MENNELNKKVLEKVRSRIVISNLESEENMKLNKKKQLISISAVLVVLFTGSFITVNAATDGELVDKVTNTIKVIFVKDDGTENEVKGTAYTDSNNHIIEKYEVEENNTNHIVEVDKNNLDKDNMTIDATINDDEAGITNKNKK